MNNARTKSLLGLVMGVAVAGAANAAVVPVSNDITTSTTWTANNVYRLKQQIYVKNGATLTIQAGTVIASLPADQGSLAVVRGSKIFVNGTQTDPVIMTSTADVATWTGGDPHTGTWREAASEWGNLTIMGKGYISNGPGSPQFVAGNTATPNANNVMAMEGLVAGFPGDPDVLFGGGDDDDDSGSIHFLSLRYGGKVIGLANELNGLSLGGIGRATDIDHIDIMNNVDDGIEVWGGAVNLKYINIWNIGDDDFDTDCGWRGKAQFGLLVQGYSVDAAQGSGVGDNLFEMDGAQDSDCQPITSPVLYNFTCVGQPVAGAGDAGTSWRDNAHIQYRNSIFMDLGEQLVEFKNVDGDGDHGYGFNGTLSWPATWTTNYDSYSNINAPPNPAPFYQAQTSGKLAEITDSVFWRNLAANAYTESDARGVTISGGSNTTLHNVVPVYNPNNPTAHQPITTLNRAAPVTKGGTTQIRVIGIDPRAANDAVSSFAAAPRDGFFTAAQYRGAFSPTKDWLCGWTAADAYGFVIAPAGSCVTPCAPDITGNQTVDVDDLLAVINSWGPCAGCPADITGNGVVDVDDLLAVINGWGACP